MPTSDSQTFFQLSREVTRNQIVHQWNEAWMPPKKKRKWRR